MKFYCLACEKEKTGEPIQRNAEATVKGLVAAFCRTHKLEDCWVANRRFQKRLRESRRDYRKRNQVKLHRPSAAPAWYGDPGTQTRQRAVELFRRIPKAAWAELAASFVRALDGEIDAETLMDKLVEELRALSSNKLI